MESDDLEPVKAVSKSAFEDLARRWGDEPEPPPPPEWSDRRVLHFVETDPGGAWVAEDDGRLLGAALASLREGIWGLSLLVVDPEAQSAGIGRALLERTLAYGNGARGGIILATLDARALRAYKNAGFAFHPAAGATGVPRASETPPTVRAGGLEDVALSEAIDRDVRGSAHGRDIEAMLRIGLRMLVVEGRAYALASEKRLYLLAACDDDAARDLLRGALARAPEGQPFSLYGITSKQPWALDVVAEADLKLELWGAQFLRGDVGRFAPYLPSGAYL